MDCSKSRRRFTARKPPTDTTSPPPPHDYSVLQSQGHASIEISIAIGVKFPIPRVTMEMRSLTRSLRPRPAISQLYTKQPSTLLQRGQFLRYSSSDNGPSKPQGNEQSPHQPAPSAPSSSPSQPPSATTSPFSKTPRFTTTPPRQPADHGDFETVLNKLNFNRKQTPTNSENPVAASSLSRDVGASAKTDNYRQPVRRVELKLGPSLGRQVHVEPEKGYDLEASLRTLNAACFQNKILQTQRRQKFHVRRGQMRKNMRMERWRKLFKFSFVNTVTKIQKMRSQGW